MSPIPVRKSTRLKDYDYSQSGCYFITVCTHNRQSLFVMTSVGNDLCVVPSEFLQNKMIEKWLWELQNKYEILIDRYIIMPDNIHLILVADAERHAGRSLRVSIPFHRIILMIILCKIC